MIIVCDASPLNYLVLIGHAEILSKLFGEVIVPTAVRDELLHRNAPEAVRTWMTSPSDWLSMRSPAKIDASLQLGPGESATISLTLELGADLVLMDDRVARRAAESRGLSVAGTLNVLAAAASRDLINLRDAVDKLRQTNFHVSNEVLDAVLAADARRRP